MEFPIIYSESLSYPDDEEEITVLVALSSGEFDAEVFAKVDTGAAVCLFSREIGLQLGLDIERGLPIRLGSVLGTLDAFGHEVSLHTGTLSFHTTVYFAKAPGLPRNFLGRRGGCGISGWESWTMRMCSTWLDTDEACFLNHSTC